MALRGVYKITGIVDNPVPRLQLDKCLYPSPVTVPCKIHDCHPGPNTAILVILVAPGQTLFPVLDHHLDMHSGIWSEVKLDLVEPCQILGQKTNIHFMAIVGVVGHLGVCQHPVFPPIVCLTWPVQKLQIDVI